MSLTSSAKEIIRSASTAGLGKDVIDLLTTKVTLLDEQLVETRISLDQASIKISELMAENKSLRQQLSDLDSTEEGLKEDEHKILKFYYDTQESSRESASQSLGIPLPEVTHHVGTLIKMGFLQHSRAAMGRGMSAQQKILHPGSSYILEHKG
ncbi:MAG: hypothetical protein ACSHX0_00520 [Akkermansiaceae bacterium]